MQEEGQEAQRGKEVGKEGYKRYHMLDSECVGSGDIYDTQR